MNSSQPIALHCSAMFNQASMEIQKLICPQAMAAISFLFTSFGLQLPQPHFMWSKFKIKQNQANFTSSSLIWKLNPSQKQGLKF